MIKKNLTFKFLMILSMAFILFTFGNTSHSNMGSMGHMNHLSQNQNMSSKSTEDGCVVLSEGTKICINDLILYIKSFLINNTNISIFISTVVGLIYLNKKELINFYKEIKLSRKFLYQKLLFYFENTKILILCHIDILFKSGILNPKTH